MTQADPTVPRLYVHDPISLPDSVRLAQHIAGYSLYVERALVLAGPGDLVCVLAPVDPDYLTYLGRLGVGPEPSGVIWPSARASGWETVAARMCRSPGDLERIAAHLSDAGRCLISPFFLSTDEVRLAELLHETSGVEAAYLGGSPELSQYMSLKTVARARAASLGIPLPESRTVHVARNTRGKLTDPAELVSAVQAAVARAGAAVVHGAQGVAGSANFLFRADSAEDAAVRRKLEPDGNTTYLVDDFIPADVSPNVLVDVPPGGAPPRLAGTSDQILTDLFTHQGNIAPSRAARREDMVQDALRLADWLQEEGYTGWAGFDFIEWGPEEEREYALCELNPRVNGANYPLGLIERFRGTGCRACLSVNLETQAAGFAELRERLGRFLLRPGEGAGLLPYNTACLAHGKFTGAFLAGSSSEAERMLVALCDECSDWLRLL